MRSGCVLVAALTCACLDTQPDRSMGHGAAFPAWDSGVGSEKPALAQPTAGRSAQPPPQAGSTAQRAKPQQPLAAGSGAGARAGASAPKPGSEGPPALPQSPAMPAPERVGDLVISELMIDPNALPDAEGEWLELHNTTDSALALRDCALDDGGKSLHALAPALLVPVGAYFTIARSADPGFEPDATLALSLTNSADSVAIVCRGVEIDRVSYDRAADFAIKPGVSLALDPSQIDNNDSASAWCDGRDAYSADLGSPGRANPDCHPDDEYDAGAGD